MPVLHAAVGGNLALLAIDASGVEHGIKAAIGSDGLFNEIDDDRIAATLRRLVDPNDAARELVRLANEAGGRDNITCVVVDVVEDAGERPTADGDRILRTVHGADRVFAELRESGEMPVIEVSEGDDDETAKVRRRSRFTWRVALFVIVGVLFLRNPGESLVTLTLLLIVLFLVEGISKVIFALTIRPLPNWGWVLGSGIIGILLAFYLWASIPVTAVWLIGVLLGIELICEGAALGYLAWQVRKA